MTDAGEDDLVTPATGSDGSRREGVPVLAGSDDVAVISEWGIEEWGERLRHELPEGVNVSVRMRVIDGVPHCTEVSFVTTRQDRGVPAKALRDFRLEDWIERACAAVASRRSPDGKYEWIGSQAMPNIRRARAKARGGYSDEMLREVAAIYRDNASHHPTKAVRQAFDVAPSTAQLYVKKARDRGFLERPPNREQGDQA